MLKSCKYCGRVHPSGYICPAKPVRHQKIRNSAADKFRKTDAWQHKRLYILDRDYNMCRICNDGKYGRFLRDGRSLQVHHIEPLEEDYDRRLDDDNLLTTCWMHHEMAEAGRIPRDYQHQLTETSPRWGID